MSNYFDNKARNKYVDYPVKEEMELMPFLQKYVGGSRTKIKELLSQRMVYVDKVQTTQFNAPLKPGQLVQIANKRHKHDFRNKWVKIVYEDAFIIVVEKAPGILSTTQPGSRALTVKDILNEYVQRTNRTFSVHSIHRLDRETSGLLLFAKRRDVQQMFTDNWKELVTDRRYVAVVQGDMEKDAGDVCSWLTDSKMFVTYSSPVDNGGKYAVTHYKTIKRANGFSLMELKLDTGRKNQIRVHMQDLKHPVVGDFKYGSTDAEYGEAADAAGRMCLHAFLLEFTHPITHEHLKFETPYPAVFRDLVSKNG
ncbi:MAG: RluA family pseudouridine synthase [Bacteroidaceae bacterium]|nr:RluA family pseudouridine synthase [Bacteroidaceae bacterium]